MKWQRLGWQHLGLRQRVMVMVVASTSLVTAGVTALQARFVTTALQEQYRAQAVAVWHTLEASYAGPADVRTPLIQKQIARVKQMNPDLRDVAFSTVIDGHLWRVASSEQHEAAGPGTPATKDAQEVMASGRPIMRREFEYGTEVFELHAPVHVGGELAGVVEIAYGLQPLSAVVREQVLMHLGISGAGMLVLLLVLWFEVDRTVLNGIGRLHRHTYAIAAGRFEGSNGRRSPGELGDLEDAFQEMEDVLGRQRQANEALQEQLRQRWKEAEERAITDLLTGLHNHSYFRQRLGEEIERARRSGEPLALLFCDIDRFKLVNDSYGHLFGDDLLVEVAGALRRCTRQIDLAARYGGEEFTVILPATTAAGARQVAERIRAAVAGEHALGARAWGSRGSENGVRNRAPEVSEAAVAGEVPGANNSLNPGPWPPAPITLSIGVACFPDDASDRESLVQAADRAMYRAKQFGRNQVRLYSEIVQEQAVLGAGEQLSLAVVKSLVAAVDARDRYTGSHSQSVSYYSAMCARALGLSEDEIDLISTAGLLHDVGKIGVPDSVLVKSGPLSEDEWRMMREHPTKGMAILASVQSLQAVVPMILHHHERFDGKGYPDGLAGEGIPLGARIIAVADTFHAVTSARPYRGARDPETALAILRSCAGTQLDPYVVAAFDQALAPGGKLDPMTFLAPAGWATAER